MNGNYLVFLCVTHGCLQKNQPKISLPVPDVERVEDYEKEHSPNFKPPKCYIHHEPRIFSEGFDEVDYVADDNDWVGAY